MEFNHMIGMQAPDFTAAAVMGDNNIEENFNLKEFTKNKTCVLFFYPLDFTFVCPTEILAFNNRLNEFKTRNVELIAVSVDSHFSHLAWKNTPVNKGGIGDIKYPLVADLSKQISKDYGVLLDNKVSLRGSFIIDKKGVIRSYNINDLPIGRNVDEVLRIVDAMHFTDENGDVCPAGWNRGKDGMKANSQGVADYLSSHASEL